MQDAVFALDFDFPTTKRPVYPFPFCDDRLPQKQARQASSGYAFDAEAGQSSRHGFGPGRPAAVVSRAPSPPPKRLIDEWGDTICVGLLQASSLLVCEVATSAAAQRDLLVMLHCLPLHEEDRVHEWQIVLLAAPKELLLEKGESNTAIGRRHGATGFEAVLRAEGDCMRIKRCLHPSSRLASMFWNQITSECYCPALEYFAQQILGRMDLDLWQNEAMKQGLKDLEDRFVVVADQAGFFGRPARERESRTRLEREKRDEMSYEQNRNPRSNREKKRLAIPEDARPFHVHVVTQEMGLENAEGVCVGGNVG